MEIIMFFKTDEVEECRTCIMDGGGGGDRDSYRMEKLERKG